MARLKEIRVPCTDAERDEIKRRAKLTSQAAATWLRRLALGYETAPPPGDVVPAPDGRSRQDDDEDDEQPTETP